MNALRSVVKELMPPVLWRLLRRVFGPKAAFTGDYISWDAASRQVSGYDTQAIVDHVLAAALKVKNSEACYERDGVLFDAPSPRYPLLAEVLASADSDGSIGVLDFGGALGSLYFQHRACFSHLRRLEWSIVEQPTFVHAGSVNLQDESLRFYASIKACGTERTPTIAIASCVLQYLPDPKSALLEILAASPKTVIDRLPLIDAPAHRLTVQVVPNRIYPASYPAWFFSRSLMLALLAENGYEVHNEFESIDTIELDGRLIRTVGWVIEKKQGNRHT
jgi:putative methyltransferase (TIGR04325 family)